MTLTATNPLTELASEVRPSIAPLEAEAEAIQIVDQDSYDEACDIARNAVEARKTIKERLEPGKAAAHTAWKEWVGLENEMLGLVEGAEKIAKGKLAKWDAEQERLRREEEARLAEEARKKEEEAKLQEAAAAEADGASEEEVEAILDEPAPQVAVMAPRTYQRNTGVTFQETWSGEVTHKPTLIQYVAKHPQFSHIFKIDQPALNAMARSQKGLFQMPGAKAVKVTNVAIK